MLDQLWTWFMTVLQPYEPRPYSTIFIAAVAFTLSLATNLANRFL
ncbi:hypothetical protein KEJ23_05680, partial [Candidatus Bathyarchaeota archaeon]|nr:hypothetical protein [Candidatus Bathyarchaeota archaeon]